MESLWRQEWKPAIERALQSYDPRYVVLLSADIDMGVGRGAVLVSGNEAPIYPYEERVFLSGSEWRSGNSGNGPSSETVWEEDESAKDRYDVSFWIETPADATGIRVAIGDDIRELPAAHGLAIVFIVDLEFSTPSRPGILAHYRGAWIDV